MEDPVSALKAVREGIQLSRSFRKGASLSERELLAYRGLSDAPGDPAYESVALTHQDMCVRRENTPIRENAISGLTSGTLLLVTS